MLATHHRHAAFRIGQKYLYSAIIGAPCIVDGDLIELEQMFEPRFVR
jgi:hypothetical protein